MDETALPLFFKMTTELKEILIQIIKSPYAIAAVLTFIVANINWLLPTVPENVTQSFTNMVTILLSVIAAYYIGKDSRERQYQKSFDEAGLPQEKK